MIEVLIRHKGSQTELGRIEIENISDEASDLGDYSIKFAVERVAAVGLHRRSMLAFPRRRYNVLGLLLQALNTLAPDELRLEDGSDIDGDGLPKRKELPR